jgi:hypothetical protein
MSHVLKLLAALTAAVAVPGEVATMTMPPTPLDDVEVTNPACIQFWGEVRYRYPGYDHIVHVVNGCDQRALCAVSTNVDPDPITITLEPHTSQQVLVRRSSPARRFTPYVVCVLEEEE